MSNAKVSNTINHTSASASTPRSPKGKKSKFVKLDLTKNTDTEKTEVTATAPVVEAPAADLTPTVDSTEPTKPDEPADSADSTESVEPAEPVAPKPVVNVWQVRKEAAEVLRKAQEALRLAEQAVKVAAVAEKVVESAPASDVPDVPATDDEFILVTSKKKSPPKKTYSGQAKPVQSHHGQPQAKPVQSHHGQPQAKPVQAQGYKGKPVQSHHGQAQGYQGKPKYVKEFTPEQQAAFERKKAAQAKAEQVVIAECLKAIPQAERDNINTGLQYTLNYRKTVVLDISNDDVIVNVEGETYQFSRLHFIENRFFQNKTRDSLSQVLPQAWIRFFPGRYEGTYCMGLQRRHD